MGLPNGGKSSHTEMGAKAPCEQGLGALFIHHHHYHHYIKKKHTINSTSPPLFPNQLRLTDFFHSQARRKSKGNVF